jgi:hypothetical protein
VSGNIVAAIITSVTTVLCVVYTNRRQLGKQTRDFEAITAKQTGTITDHVTDTVKDAAP